MFLYMMVSLCPSSPSLLCVFIFCCVVSLLCSVPSSSTPCVGAGM